MRLMICALMFSLFAIPVFSLEKASISADGTLDLYDKGIKQIENITALYTEEELADVQTLYLDVNEITEIASLISRFKIIQ